MKFKTYTARFLFALPFLTTINFHGKDQMVVDDDDWVGSIYYNYVMFDKGKREDGEIKTEWKFIRNVEIRINVKGKNKGYAYTTDRLDNWQQQIAPFANVKATIITTEMERGKGEGEVEVWVEMDKESGTYWLKTNGPQYFTHRRSRVWSSVIEMAGQEQPEDTSSRINDGIAIDAPDQKIGKNPKELSGSYVILSTPTLKVTVNWNLRKKCPPWNNLLTQTNINTLEPKVKAAATRFIQRVNDELCIRLKIASAYRTIDEQNALYAIGRDKNGRKIGETVTNARGGQSNHNFKRAIDVYYATDTGIELHRVLAPEIVNIAKQEGFEWGGDWSEPDYPHFEMKSNN